MADDLLLIIGVVVIGWIAVSYVLNKSHPMDILGALVVPEIIKHPSHGYSDYDYGDY